MNECETLSRGCVSVQGIGNDAPSRKRRRHDMVNSTKVTERACVVTSGVDGQAQGREHGRGQPL
ncbi:unnamed protein product, partial [Ectocarpus sp. 4 AP-2014]